MGEWDVVPAGPADHPAVKAIARQSPYTAGVDRMRYFLGSREVLLVARGSDGHVIGFCQGVHLRRQKYSSIYHFGVDREHRRGGVGRVLADAMQQAAPSKVLRLQVDERNTEGLTFYTSLGFAEIGRKTSRVGHKLITLQRG